MSEDNILTVIAVFVIFFATIFGLTKGWKRADKIIHEEKEDV